MAAGALEQKINIKIDLVKMVGGAHPTVAFPIKTTILAVAKTLLPLGLTLALELDSDGENARTVKSLPCDE